MTDIQIIPLDRLEAHPSNSNVMPAELLDKLADHVGRTDRYPPVIVRTAARPDRFQILDGHHRVLALRKIGRAEARCVVWEVDDAEALVLMATLNRLQGRDDPYKRAALVEELSKLPGLDVGSLARRLPERAADLEALLALRKAPAVPRPPRGLEEMPVAVHFFLTPGQRAALEARLRAIGGPREAALMALVG